MKINWFGFSFSQNGTTPKLKWQIFLFEVSVFREDCTGYWVCYWSLYISYSNKVNWTVWSAIHWCIAKVGLLRKRKDIILLSFLYRAFPFSLFCFLQPPPTQNDEFRFRRWKQNKQSEDNPNTYTLTICRKR